MSIEAGLVEEELKVVPSLGKLSISLIVTLLSLMLVLLGSHEAGLSLADLTDDPSLSNSRAWFAGGFSTFGFILMAMATGVAFFSVSLRKFLAVGRRRTSASFWIGVCSATLLADDAYMLHDSFFPYILNVPEIVPQLLIGGAVFTVLFVFRKAIGESFFFAIPAVSCWVVSVLIDIGLDDSAVVVLLIEDGFKILGICFWLQFCWDMAKRSVAQMLKQKTAELGA
jgi:hypothetical protein